MSSEGGGGLSTWQKQKLLIQPNKFNLPMYSGEGGV